MSTEDPRLQLGPQLTQHAADACREALDELRPIVRISPRADPTTARAAAALAHLLGRLHPHTTVDGDALLDTNPWSASSVCDAAGLIPRAHPASESTRDIVIAVGGHVSGHWYVGGDDWTMYLSNETVSAIPGRMGLGLQAAASFAAAELLKTALAPLGLASRSALPLLVWNLVDYRLRPAPMIDERWRRPPPAVLFGGGSVGSSAAAHLVGGIPSSEIEVVDADTFDPRRNAYRYPASTTATCGPKATWLAQMLRDAGWTTGAHVGDVASWVASRDAPAFAGVAISSVDRIDARADVADSLPAMTLSVGVSGLAFHVQLEHPADEFACPFCQYLNVGPPLSNIEAIAEQVGVALPRVAALLAGDRLSVDDLARAVAAGRIAASGVEDLIGRRIEDLIRRAYAEAAVPTESGAVVNVSAPAVSWLGGVVVAAEFAKLAAGLPPLDRRVDLDLTGTPAGVQRQVARDRSGRCLCASPFRRRASRSLPDLHRLAS